jgi:hypothetical protein
MGVSERGLRPAVRTTVPVIWSAIRRVMIAVLLPLFLSLVLSGFAKYTPTDFDMNVHFRWTTDSGYGGTKKKQDTVSNTGSHTAGTHAHPKRTKLHKGCRNRR